MPLHVAGEMCRSDAAGAAADVVRALLATGAASEAPGSFRDLLGGGAAATYASWSEEADAEMAATATAAGGIGGNYSSPGRIALRRPEIETRDAAGATPLFAAAFFGRTATALALLELGARADTVGLDGETPLIAAAARGHADTVRALLRSGADVNSRGADGASALHRAAANAAPSHSRVLAELLERPDAHVDARDAGGRTPLMFAARSGDLQRVRLLLARGACRLIRDNAGLNAVRHATTLAGWRAAHPYRYMALVPRPEASLKERKNAAKVVHELKQL